MVQYNMQNGSYIESWFETLLFELTVHGCWDLFRMPVEQYRRDGRIVRGIQRGANSFMTCTAMSTLELTNRLVQTIQVTLLFPSQYYTVMFTTHARHHHPNSDFVATYYYY